MDNSERELTGQYHWPLLDAIFRARQSSKERHQYVTYEKCNEPNCTCELYRISNRFDPKVVAYNKANPLRDFKFHLLDEICDTDYTVTVKARSEWAARLHMGSQSGITINWVEDTLKGEDNA